MFMYLRSSCVTWPSLGAAVAALALSCGRCTIAALRAAGANAGVSADPAATTPPRLAVMRAPMAQRSAIIIISELR